MRSPEESTATLRQSLGGFRGDLTVADAAAKSGLSLLEAEQGLRRLLVEVDAHLAATDQGELLYSFPHGLAAKRSGGFLSRTWSWLQKGARVAGRAVVRSFVGVFLVGYAIVFALLIFLASIALSVAAEDGGPTEAAGYLLFGVVELLLEALYWSAHPLTEYRAGVAWKSKQRERQRHTASFYERINNFFFGPPEQRDDPLQTTTRVLERIRARRGRIGILDVMQAAGIARAEADALIAKLMLDYEGDVDVTDSGAIVYRFEKLRKTAARKKLIEQSKRGLPEVAPLTGNSAGANAAVIALVAFNALMGFIGISLHIETWSFWLGTLPFFGSLGLLAFPLARLLARPFLVARKRMERARATLRNLVVDDPRGGVTEHELNEAFEREAKRAPKEGELSALLTEVAQDIDVDSERTANGERLRYRFRDLEAEVRALEQERAAAPENEQDIGAVVFSSKDERV